MGVAGLGAIIGAGLRYFINVALPHNVVTVESTQAALSQGASSAITTHFASFPWSTFTVNVFGAFAIGICAFLPAIADVEIRRTFVITGILGGFTTFSALALDAVTLQNPALAALYVGATFVVGVLATHAGVRLTGWRS